MSEGAQQWHFRVLLKDKFEKKERERDKFEENRNCVIARNENSMWEHSKVMNSPV